MPLSMPTSTPDERESVTAWESPVATAQRLVDRLERELECG
jgi:hypothetical protein